MTSLFKHHQCSFTINKWGNGPFIAGIRARNLLNTRPEKKCLNDETSISVDNLKQEIF